MADQQWQEFAKRYSAMDLAHQAEAWQGLDQEQRASLTAALQVLKSTKRRRKPLLYGGLGLLALLVLIGVLAPEKPGLQSPASSPAKPFPLERVGTSESRITAVERAYLGSAGGYLQTLNTQDARLATAMAGANTGRTTLGEIKKAIERCRFVENAGWYGDYKKNPAPPSLAYLDRSITECRRLHASALDEMLEYWEDGNLEHVQSGTQVFETAVRETNKCIDEVTQALRRMKN